MKRIRHTPEQIIRKLREAEAELAKGTADRRGLQGPRHRREHLLPLAEPVRRHEGRRGEAAQGAGEGERPAQGPGRRPGPGQGDPAGGRPGKLVSPARRRQAVERAVTALGVSERRACRALGVAPIDPAVRRDRTRTRGSVVVADAGAGPGAPPLRLPAGHGVAAAGGLAVNRKRVQRLWRREGLKVPQVQRKRRRLGHERERLHPAAGRAARPRLELRLRLRPDGRRPAAEDAADRRRVHPGVPGDRGGAGPDGRGRGSTLEYLFEVRGVPEHIRSDNGPEFIAEAVQEWLARRGCEDAVHRAGEPVGERLQRDVQQPAAGRAAGPGGVRDAEGGEGDHRGPSPGVQPPPPAQFAGVSDPGGVRSGLRRAGGRFAPPGRRRADPRPRTLITPGPEFGGRSLA